MNMLTSESLILVVCLICVFAIYMYTKIQIAKNALSILGKMIGSKGTEIVVVVTHKSHDFKEIDAILSENKMVDVKIILLSTRWIYQIKQKKWKNEIIYFIDSNVVSLEEVDYAIRLSPSKHVKYTGGLEGLKNATREVQYG
ncbi:MULTISPECIES: hypothetical protein [Paenibacillus]|uniref:hypothetical protein n=1 Tax=Paenibacillus TaxID=44249 RepID=UPI001FFF5680|nr:hypothetical protein [Paenibacillus pabuli]UPK44365.1 hypothetical protein KET34_02140 [Paenibacillus pabuli]